MKSKWRNWKFVVNRVNSCTFLRALENSTILKAFMVYLTWKRAKNTIFLLHLRGKGAAFSSDFRIIVFFHFTYFRFAGEKNIALMFVYDELIFLNVAKYDVCFFFERWKGWEGIGLFGLSIVEFFL